MEGSIYFHFFLFCQAFDDMTACSFCLLNHLFSSLYVGVGRLAFDITALGYSVQGNDFSLFMLLASDFMLNGGIATPKTQS